MAENIVQIVGIILGSSVLSILITSIFAKRKSDADAATLLVESNLRWSDKLVARIDELEKILEQRNKEIIELRLEILGLKNTIEDFKEVLVKK